MKRPTLALMAMLVLALAACSRGNAPEAMRVEDMTEFPRDDYVYRITPGDELQIDVEGDPDYNYRTTVLADGRAVVKYAGEMDVYQLTLREFRDRLRARLVEAKYYREPRLQIGLLRATGPDPIVFLGNWSTGTSRDAGGNVSNAKVIPYRKGLGLTECIALAGGPGEPNYDLAPSVYVVRNIKTVNNRKVYKFDMSKAVYGGSPDLPLHPGDVVFLDQSWLQDLGRALGVTAQVAGIVGNALSGALLIDLVADGGLGD
jgi:protein involved in polysaccharide export with SLBB domain